MEDRTTYDKARGLSRGASAAIDTAVAVGPLDGFASRIHNMARRVEDIALGLDEHANALHGATPPGNSSERKPETAREGALGRILDALDRMENAIDRAGMAAERNVHLA